MRVLIVGPRFPDSFADNLASTMEARGDEVLVEPGFRGPIGGPGRVAARLRGELAATPDMSARLQRHLVHTAEATRPELVLSVDACLSKKTVERLRGASEGPVVLWFPDSPGNLGRETHVLAGYDALFLKDSLIARHYRDVLRLDAHFLPEACNPRWHRPVGELWSASDPPTVLLAGNVYATRFVFLRTLVARGVRLVIYGPAWPRWLPEDPALAAAYTGTYLAREDKAREFRGAGVVLNTLASHEADGLNCRLFEATACGGIVLTERRQRLDEFFSVPEEVSAFSDFNECMRGLQRLLALQPEERAEIGAAASARAHADHTYAHRLESMLAILGRG
jgi:spore maturation protein CgeB